MPLNARIIKALVYRIAVILFIGALSGCGSKSGQLLTYMRPELLYLNPQPYSRLYVEVDTIEGFEVTDQLLNELKSFLNKYCSKPDGIEIVKDKPVPISEIEELSIGLASILCTDGPGTGGIEQPAYLHVLFHKKTGLEGGERTSRVSSFCPCGIFCTEGKAKAFALKHEAGHVLGLCKNTAHGDSAHCRNRGCMMYAHRDLFWSLGSLAGLQMDKLCDDCQLDLELGKSELVEPNLLFKGPFLIRQEDGYSVASLPFCDLIIPASVESVLDWNEALSFIKEKIKEAQKATLNKDRESRKKMWYVTGLYNPNDTNTSPLSEIDELAILKRAATDPSLPVKNYAMDKLKEFEQEQ